MLVWLALAGCASEHPHAAVAPPDDQQAIALIEVRCTVCHPADRIYGSVGSAEDWSALVHRMAYHHKAKLIAHLSDQEASQIAAWLGANQKLDRTGVHIGFQPTGRPL